MQGFLAEADWDPRPGVRLTPTERRSRTVWRGGSVWRHARGRLTEVPVPAPGPDEVLLQVGATGICGTDLHLLGGDADGYTLHDGHSHFPLIPGHELSGTVVETGADVTGPRVGQPVAVESMNWCGRCDACRRGLFNQCREVREPGLTYDGGFAEYTVVPAKHCYPLDTLLATGLPVERVLELGALVEPAGVAYNGLFVHAGGFRPGRHAVVVGAGPVGLAAVALLRAAGAGTVTCLETSDARRRLAATLGADHVLAPSAAGDGDVADAVLEITGGQGASVLAECSGAGAAVYPTMQRAMAPGAQVVQLGFSAGPTPVDLLAFQAAGARIVGSIGQSGSGIYSDVIALMSSGRIDLAPMITDRVPLSRIDDAFVAARRATSGKVMVSSRYG